MSTKHSFPLLTEAAIHFLYKLTPFLFIIWLVHSYKGGVAPCVSGFQSERWHFPTLRVFDIFHTSIEYSILEWKTRNLLLRSTCSKEPTREWAYFGRSLSMYNRLASWLFLVIWAQCMKAWRTNLAFSFFWISEVKPLSRSVTVCRKTRENNIVNVKKTYLRKGHLSLISSSVRRSSMVLWDRRLAYRAHKNIKTSSREKNMSVTSWENAKNGVSTVRETRPEIGEFGTTNLESRGFLKESDKTRNRIMFYIGYNPIERFLIVS